MKSIVFIFLILLSITDVWGSILQIENDTLIGPNDTLIIKGDIFIFENQRLKEPNILYLIKNNNRRILLFDYKVDEIKFVDTNNDNFKDVLFCGIIKNALYCYLFVYDEIKQDFIEVKNFQKFSDPQKIPNSKYMQSTHTWMDNTGHVDQQQLFIVKRNKVKVLYTYTDYVYDDEKKNKTILEYCGKKVRINTDYSEGMYGPYDEQKELEADARFWQKILKKYKGC